MTPLEPKAFRQDRPSQATSHTISISHPSDLDSTSSFLIHCQLPLVFTSPSPSATSYPHLHLTITFPSLSSQPFAVFQPLLTVYRGGNATATATATATAAAAAWPASPACSSTANPIVQHRSTRRVLTPSLDAVTIATWVRAPLVASFFIGVFACEGVGEDGAACFEIGFIDSLLLARA
jgi:hypothetical protein